MSKSNVNKQDESIGEDLYNRAAGVSGGGLTSRVEKEPPVIGYRRPIRDPRLVRYDRFAARQKPPVHWEVTRDDRMSAEEAGDKMAMLYQLYGVKGAQPEVLEAFHEAIYFSHTMNSGSVIQPGRSDIVLSGNRMNFKLAVDFLGTDLRRFFRAYADEVREANARVLSRAYDSTDIVVQEKAAWLREKAESRGLVRYPELAHDTSDCCWNLNDSQRAALNASKAMVFGSTQNMVDRNRYRPGQSGETSAGSMFVGPSAQPNALAVN